MRYIKRIYHEKVSLLFCLLILAACSKNEVISPLDDLSPVLSATVSHLCNDDLVLVDGLIQLKINKEDALKRGVPESEYALVEETINKHNKEKEELLKKSGKTTIQTKAQNGFPLAAGMRYASMRFRRAFS